MKRWMMNCESELLNNVLDMDEAMFVANQDVKQALLSLELVSSVALRLHDRSHSIVTTAGSSGMFVCDGVAYTSTRKADDGRIYPSGEQN
jgi:hypothetical protein